MKTQLYGLLAETSIHAGSGQSTGYVDLPFGREAATDYPVIPGSSVKGALRALARQDWKNEYEAVFGKPDQAGALIVSDARLLLLPVRSMTSHYRWITCPYLIERAARDWQRAYGKEVTKLDHEALKKVKNGTYLGKDVGSLYLEERQFAYSAALPAGVIELVSTFIPQGPTSKRLADQLDILCDDDFVWFARHGLAITARNNLDEEKKTSNNLWYEETLPPDSLMYLLLVARDDAAIKQATAIIGKQGYIQMGGNETVGQGWFAAHPCGGGQ